MMIRPLFALSTALLCLTACTASETDPSVSEPTTVAENDSVSSDRSARADAAKIQSEDGVTEIAWEDLMPEGEDERLEALYTEFYAELEERMIQRQANLSTALTDGEDLDLSNIAEGSDLDTMTQIGTFNVVESLNGESIRLPGYIVPLDFSAEAEHTEFLLVPYFGACLHSPPPPPNQIIYVTSDPAAKIPDIYEPVWLEGTLTTGRFDTAMANSAYELALSKLEPYEY